MSDNFEACWERFSDELSFALNDIAASDHISEETVDKLQYAAVTIFREHLDSILLNPTRATVRSGDMTLQ